MDSSHKIGVLLMNVGTPNSFQKKDVRRYLRQFLWDKRVLDIPVLFRFLLLYFIILPFRTKKSAAAYRSVWTAKGSPLSVYSREFAQKMQATLPSHFVVEEAMRYQNPSIALAIDKLLQNQVQRIIVFPLFPQYSSAATGSALEEVYKKISTHWNVVPVTTVPSFYKNTAFIECFFQRIQEVFLKYKADYVLFSYHGLPERHIFKSEQGQKKGCLLNKKCCDSERFDNAFCYRAHCFATTRALVQKLNLQEGSYSTSFQSRLGRTKWIEPYTDKVLPSLDTTKIKKIAVVCPSFVADCLETLEEIAIRAKEDWLLCGGEDLVLIPSLNAQDDWVQTAANIVKGHAHVST